MFDWDDFLARLRAAATGTSPPAAEPDLDQSAAIDDVIDAALERVSLSSPALEHARAVPALVEALAAARSRSTKRDVAQLLALAPGGVHEAEVVDALAAAYRSARSDAVLGSELLDALGTLAERSALGAAAVSDALLRLSPRDDHFLLVRAAKVIGRLEALGVATRARGLLGELTQNGAADLAVEGEARQQLAVLALADALRQPNVAGLREALRGARLALVKADLSNEQRIDARQLIAFVDLVLAYLDAGTARDAEGIARLAATLADLATRLKAQIDDPHVRPWYGYASPSESVVEWRLYRVALGFERLAEVLGTAEEWTHFDEELLEVAAALEVMVAPPGRSPPRVPAVDASVRGGLSRQRAALGPLLERVVGRARLGKVLQRFAASGGSTATAAVLGDLHAAACASEYAEPPPASVAIDRTALRELAEGHPIVIPQLAAAVPGISELLREMGMGLLLDLGERSTVAAASLPLDAPNCFGNDPAVDDTVRRILADAAARLGPTKLRRAAWRQLARVVESVVRLARDTRNNLPAFARSEDDGGKGQTAGEGDLQEYLFDHLAREYGRSALYEAARNSGGRPDSGVRLGDIEIPIEVKADYRRVDPQHVRENYLAQPDQYASNRDGVAFLLILDLRPVHAARHISQRRAGPEPQTLYSLQESFRVDGLPVDPAIPGARPNAVVVGLIPGNQVRPSSMTRYGRRPR